MHCIINAFEFLFIFRNFIGRSHLEPRQVREARHGRLLDGADHIGAEVHGLEAVEAGQRQVAHALDAVAREAEHAQPRQVLEGRGGVLHGVGQLVAVQVELLQQRDLHERVLGLDVGDEVVLEVQVLEAGQPLQDVPLHYLQLISLCEKIIKVTKNIFVSVSGGKIFVVEVWNIYLLLFIFTCRLRS